jgi:hypothetical protein
LRCLLLSAFGYDVKRFATNAPAAASSTARSASPRESSVGMVGKAARIAGQPGLVMVIV